jgi:hypothetical protein
VIVVKPWLLRKIDVTPERAPDGRRLLGEPKLLAEHVK